MTSGTKTPTGSSPGRGCKNTSTEDWGEILGYQSPPSLVGTFKDRRPRKGNQGHQRQSAEVSFSRVHRPFQKERVHTAARHRSSPDGPRPTEDHYWPSLLARRPVVIVVPILVGAIGLLLLIVYFPEVYYLAHDAIRLIEDTVKELNGSKDTVTTTE